MDGRPTVKAERRSALLTIAKNVPRRFRVCLPRWGSELALREPGRVKCLVLMDTDRSAEPDATLKQYSQMFNAIESLGSIPAPMIDIIVPLFFRRGATLDGEVHARFRKALAGFSADQLRQSVVPLGRLIFGRCDALC